MSKKDSFSRNILPIPDRPHTGLFTYGPKDTTFTGRVNWVQIDIDEAAEDFDLLISSGVRLLLAMARQ